MIILWFHFLIMKVMYLSIYSIFVKTHHVPEEESRTYTTAENCRRKARPV